MPKDKAEFHLVETLKATDMCCMAHLNGNQDLRGYLVSRAWKLLKRNKEQFIMNLAEKVEGHFLL